jgi:hypothetical protein
MLNWWYIKKLAGYKGWMVHRRKLTGKGTLKEAGRQGYTEGSWQARVHRRKLTGKGTLKEADTKNRTKLDWDRNWAPAVTAPPPSRFFRIILNLSVRTSQRITLFLLSQANRLKIVRKIDAVQPNGAQNVSTVLTAVYCQSSRCLSVPLRHEGSLCARKVLWSLQPYFEQDKRQ